MRNTFINELVKYARLNDNVVLIVGDLGFSAIEPFCDEFPDRFVNAGVAEQNMTAMAAGMASEGYHVFTYSIANFPTFRCAEQIRNDIDYHKLAVTVVSVGGGLAYGNLGYSHHAVQDFSLMRAMPNFLIAAPCDPYQTQSCLDFMIKNPRPYYLRLNKAGEPNLTEEDHVLHPGVPFFNETLGRKKNLLLTTGAVYDIGYDIWHHDANFRSNWMLGNLPLWGESTREEVVFHLQDFENIIVLEEHLLAGGFASWLLESGVKCTPCYLDVSTCGRVGTQGHLKQDLKDSLSSIIASV